MARNMRLSRSRNISKRHILRGSAYAAKVTFIKKDGSHWTRHFFTRQSAGRAILGWRKAGGRISHVN
jgi:hypothetical protein